jgi:RNA polymerase sigma-70 factor (ECF subfamily)
MPTRRSRPGTGFGSLEELYARYSPSVLGFLRGRGVPDAEDVVGEVFVSVVRSLDRFEGDEEAFRRWLFTIAHRRAVDAHRRQARRHEAAVAPQELPEAAAGGADGADATVVEDLGSSPVGRALSRLTDDQRAVLLLRVVADLSVSDTAAVLDKPEGAVKTLHRRALAALRRALLILAVS